MRISSRVEDYLETIFRLSMELDTVGVTDVARARKVSVPTARTAVGRLARLGFLHQKPYGKIILHDTGRQKGDEIFRIHLTLRKFLQDVLLVKADIAEKEACRMEHGLSLETLERLHIFLMVLEKEKRFRAQLVQAFRGAIQSGATAPARKETKAEK
jgi:DtxR family Mn-dependent transcriptional regulator